MWNSKFNAASSARLPACSCRSGRIYFPAGSERSRWPVRQQWMAAGIAKADHQTNLGQCRTCQSENGGEAAISHTRCNIEAASTGRFAAPLVDIELNGSKVTAAVWTLPGQDENTVVSAARLWTHALRIHGHEQRIQRLRGAHFERALDCNRWQNHTPLATAILWPARNITSTWKAGRF